MANEWIQVGARVAEYTDGRVDGTVTLATIDRLTATQVVLSNGNKYNRATLRQVGANRSGWRTPTLEDVASERVRAVRTATVVRNVLYDISIITRDGKTRGVAVLDEIDRLVAAARDKIARMD
jgi:hypothetical protein